MSPASTLIAAGQMILEMRTEMERVEDVMEYPDDPALGYGAGTEKEEWPKLKGEVERGERYWFSDEEVAALQRANAQYQSTVDLERIVCDVFRHPRSDEPCRPMTMSEVIEYIQCDYSFVQPTRSMKIQLGLALAAQGFESKREAAGYSYFVVPRR